MVRVKFLVRAAAIAMASSTAYAADMPQPLPPPPPQQQLMYQPMQMVMGQPQSAWYLRGFIGVGITSNVEFIFEQNPLNNSNFGISHASMADTVFFGGGVGYEFNNWLRFDVTGEYRSKSAVNAYGTYSFGGGVFGDQYSANLKSTVILANAYFDLGTWDCVTPFVGFGVGGAWNTFGDLVDTGIGTSGNGVGTSPTQLSFAWALHAGLAYNVTQNFSMELAYRYLNYGTVHDQIFCDGGCNPDTYKIQNMTSNDFMLGMRWRFPIESAPIMVAPQPAMMMQQAPMQQAPVYAPPPVMVPQPAPVYAPPYQPQYQPPQYQQPQYPLSTRG